MENSAAHPVPASEETMQNLPREVLEENCECIFCIARLCILHADPISAYLQHRSLRRTVRCARSSLRLGQKIRTSRSSSRCRASTPSMSRALCRGSSPPGHVPCVDSSSFHSHRTERRAPAHRLAAMTATAAARVPVVQAQIHRGVPAAGSLVARLLEGLQASWGPSSTYLEQLHRDLRRLTIDLTVTVPIVATRMGLADSGVTAGTAAADRAVADRDETRTRTTYPVRGMMSIELRSDKWTQL